MDQYHAKSSARTVIACLGLGTLYVAASSLMIESNKWMMLETHFPYATVLCTLQMLLSMLFSSAFYLLRPSWFTAMRSLKTDIWFFLKVLPIGVCFAGSLVLSNEAYKFLSVSCIQMLKEANIALVFAMSVVLGLMKFQKVAALLLAVITTGAMLAAYGTVEVVLVGIIIQGMSQLFEVTKIVTQNVLMNSRGMKLDPLTLVLFMAPVCLLFLVPLSAYMVHGQWGDVIQRAMHVWPTLLLNCLVAFSLNVIVAMEIWLFNGVGFLVAALTKDVTIVVVAGILFGEVITEIQLVGFTVALCGVLFYSLYRMNEAHFADDNIFTGFISLFGDMASTSVKTARQRAADQRA